MVEGYANITIKGVIQTVKLDALELAQIVANRKGFSVVDAEPLADGSSWSIKAHSNGKVNASVSANGRSLTEAVTGLIERIW